MYGGSDFCNVVTLKNKYGAKHSGQNPKLTKGREHSAKKVPSLVYFQRVLRLTAKRKKKEQTDT